MTHDILFHLLRRFDVYIYLAKSGYRTLSKNIPEFAKINEMPIPLDIRRIAEGDGIKYHESCRLMFNNTKLALSLLCNDVRHAP
jgi:hypothetical protein